MFLLGNLGFDVQNRTDWVRWFIALPVTVLWAATVVAYFVSRMNDGWDQEARERRAQRSSLSPQSDGPSNS